MVHTSHWLIVLVKNSIQTGPVLYILNNVGDHILHWGNYWALGGIECAMWDGWSNERIYMEMEIQQLDKLICDSCFFYTR